MQRSRKETSNLNWFLTGARKSLPVILSAGPFGVLFGALAVENGMTIAEAVFMTATLFAGASQMVGIELFGQQIAPWMIVLAIFAVNFRHVLYSASIGRHLAHFSPVQKYCALFFLTDPQFAETELLAQRVKRISKAWYFGYALALYVAWVLEGFIGAYFGSYITQYSHLGIDFFLPVYFLGLLMSFRARNDWLSVVCVSGVASIIAWHTIGSPWHVSVGAIAGVLFAAAIYKPEPTRLEEL